MTIEPPFSARRTVVTAAVEEIARTKVYGQRVTTAELEKLFGVVWPERVTRREAKTLGAMFAGFKADFEHDLLTKHRMALRSRGKGQWEIVAPRDQARYAAEVARRGFADTTAKSLAIVTHIDRTALTDEQRRQADDTAARLAGIQALTARGLSVRGLPAKVGGKP